jgi:hypothetical protein
MLLDLPSSNWRKRKEALVQGRFTPSSRNPYSRYINTDNYPRTCTTLNSAKMRYLLCPSIVYC